MTELYNMEVCFWSTVCTRAWNLSHLLLSDIYYMPSLCVWQVLIWVTTWCHGEVGWVPILLVLQWAVLVRECVVSPRQPCTGHYSTSTMMQPLHEWIKEAYMWRNGCVLTGDAGPTCRERHGGAVWVYCGYLLCRVQGKCGSRVVCKWCHAHVGGAAKGLICCLGASLLAAPNHYSAFCNMGWWGWHHITL